MRARMTKEPMLLYRILFKEIEQIQIDEINGDLLTMKRVVLVAFCIIALCSLGLVMKTGTVRAYKAGYEVNDFVAIRTCTVDGNWTTPDEWTDAAEKQLDGSLNAIFRLKYVSDGFTYVNQYYLIEFFDDTTNDTDDYWQICYDGGSDGGSAPGTDCLRMDFVGHNTTGFTFYKGDGSAWATSSDYSWGTNIFIVDTFGSSPLSDTPHWIVEIFIEHFYFAIAADQWIRVAAYDASNSDAGVQAWPDSSVNVPDDWGVSYSMMEPIPEALTIGVMVLLSSVSVLIGSHYFRKRSRKREK